MDSLLGQARGAYADCRWSDAYERFHAARQSAELNVDDLAALADAAWWLGHNDESLELSEQLYQRYRKRDETAKAAQLAVEVGFLWLLRGEPTIGSGWINRATRALDLIPENPTRGYLLYLGAAEAVDQGRFEDAIDTAKRIEVLADRHNDPTLFAIGLVTEGVAVIKQGRVDDGLAILDEAMLPVRAGEVSPNWAGNLYCQLMSLFFELNDIRRAQDWTDATERWCSLHNNPAMFVGICRVHQAQLLRLKGAWKDAEQHAAQACADLAAMNVDVVAEGKYLIGDLCRLRDDFSNAQKAYDRAHELGRDPQPGLALLRLAEGWADAASRGLQTALAGMGQPLGRAPLLSAQVDVAAAAGDADLARQAADQLVSIADLYRTSGLEAMARQASGTARLVAGEPERAIPLLRDAARRWRELDAAFPVAQVQCVLARALEAIGDVDAADRELNRAGAILTKLGRESASRTANPPSEAMKLGGLSSREAEVLAHVAAGATNRVIASELQISERTVERHVANIFGKLDVSSRTEAAGYAFEHDLIHPSHP